MSRLAIYLLGPPRIERDGVPIKVDTRKAVALLAYLAVTDQRHRRESLVNLLWPEYDSQRGRTTLRRTLYSLRKAIAGTWLDVDREEIGLHAGADIRVDLDQFHHHLAACETHGHPPSQVCPTCVDPLAKAVALYRGDFLSGFSLRDSYNFDDWQLFQAEELRRELAEALVRLQRWHTTQREFELAVGYARRRLAVDPLDEGAHCDLMRLYAWSGQRSAALGQYKECAVVLQDQLGVPPQAATTQLYTAIKEGRAPPPPPADRLPDLPTRPPPFLEPEKEVEKPVFVAREQELAQLEGFLEGALAGEGKVVFVTGDAGSGKTALIQEFARHAQAAHPDLVIAWGHGNAHTGAGDPYLPFREVLGLLTGDVEAQWAAGAMTREQALRLWHLLPRAVGALVENGPDLVDLFVAGAPLIKRAGTFTPWPDSSASLTQFEELVVRKATGSANPNLQQSALFEQYTHLLCALAGKSPLLLALDDLQWADSGSVNLLFHLGRCLPGNRILIVSAYRPGGVALGRPAATQPATIDGERERHPLEPVVNEFKRYFGDIEVDLEQAEGRPFVDALLDSEPNRLSRAFRQSIYQQTKGHPLFTVELLRGMQERGELAQDAEGHWVEGPALGWELLPARVEAVVAERIGRLPDPLRNLLTIASIEGETFTAEVLAQVAAAGEREIIRNLSETLDRRHRLVSARGVQRIGRRNLSRYRFRHTLYQRYLYGSLDPVERVHLHQAVGFALETLYGESAEQVSAIESGAVQLARHFEAAGITEKAVDYLRQAAERAQWLYANEEAIETYERALVLLKEAPPEACPASWRREMAAQLHENLGDVLEWVGRHARARAAYQAALTHVPKEDRYRQAHLHRKTGNIWRLQSRYEEALGTYDLAEIVLGPTPVETEPKWWQEWMQIQLERMWTYYWLGQWREISKLADQVRPAVEQYGTSTQCISFFLSLASMYNRRDRYVVSEETLAFCRTALTMSQETEDPSEIAWARFMLGFSQLWHGDLDDAEKQMRAALVLAEKTGDVVHQSRCLTYLTVLYRKRGQSARTRQYASQSLTAAITAQMQEYIGMVRANLAWVAWRAGDPSQAEAEGRAALDLWHQLPATHSSCAFQWTALWPLVGAALAQNQTPEAVAHARALLEPTQQRLPARLAAIVEQAIIAWEKGNPAAAHTCLDQATELAQELGYL